VRRGEIPADNPLATPARDRYQAPYHEFCGGWGSRILDIEEKLSELIDDPEFRGIDQRFGRFNLFEALGAVRRELEHSNFLAFLLSPTRPHGLGAEPLRRMLRCFLEALPPEKRPIRVLDVVVRDVDDAVVHRERDNIDLLIELAELKFVVAIENKVGAKASEGQLERYATVVRNKYPGWRQLFVFLTPEGTDPENDDYIAISYLELARTIDRLVEDSLTAQSGEVIAILRHYLEMLRRYVVPDEQLRELAIRIYERHREALDFIFDCRPEPGSLVGVVRELIGKAPSLVQDRQSPSIARFIPHEWENIASLNACPKEVWTKTGRNLLFEIRSFKTEANDLSDRILLSLILGPADPVIREHFFSKAHSKPQTFTGASSSIGKQWTTLFSKELLSRAAAKTMDEDQKTATATAEWNAFVEHELPKLTAAVIEIAQIAPTAPKDLAV